MNSNIKGVDRIGARIKAEAEEFARAEIQKATAEAEKMISDAAKIADKKAADIVNKAEDKAAALIESAKSSAGMRERNSMLALKVEMMEKAFEKALDKLVNMPEDKYVPAMASLFSETANGFLSGNNKATVYFARKDIPLADKILNEAKAKITVDAEIEKGERELSAKAGFVLAQGDTEVNCTAEAIIASVQNSLEKPVLDILFGKA